MYSNSISDTTPANYYAYFISEDNINKIKNTLDNKAKRDEILKNIPSNIIEKNNKISFTKLNDFVNISYNGSILDIDEGTLNDFSAKINTNYTYNINNMLGLNNKNTNYNILQKLFIKEETINDETKKYLYNDFTLNLKNNLFSIGYFYDYDNYTVNNDDKVLQFGISKLDDLFLINGTNLNSITNLINNENPENPILSYECCYNLYSPYIINNYLELNEQTKLFPDDTEEIKNEINNFNFISSLEIINSENNPYIFNEFSINKINLNEPTEPIDGINFYYKIDDNNNYAKLVYIQNNQIIREYNPIYRICYIKKINEDEQPIIFNNYYQYSIKNNTLISKTKKELTNEEGYNDLNSYIKNHLICELNNYNEETKLIFNENKKDVYTNNISSNKLYYDDIFNFNNISQNISLSSINPFKSKQYLRLIKSFINDIPKSKDITTNNYYEVIPERFRPNSIMKFLIPIECCYYNSSLFINSSNSSSNTQNTPDTPDTQNTPEIIFNETLDFNNENVNIILSIFSTLTNNYGTININNKISKNIYAPLIILPNGLIYIDISSINTIIQEELNTLNNINITEDIIEYNDFYVLRHINILAFDNIYDTSIKLNKDDLKYYYTFNNNNDIIFSYHNNDDENP